MTAKHKSSVSVVIPVYNRPISVVRAVNSVLRQSTLPEEILVVDDASTDETCAAVQAIDNPIVKLITRKTNGGGSVARNEGARRARGRYIAFLDSDDIWNSEKLERQIDALKKCPDHVICYSNLRFLGGDNDGKLWNTKALQGPSDIERYLFDLDQAIQTSTIMVSKTFFHRVMFDERLARHQDWDFIVRAVRIGAEFVYLDQPLVLFDQSEVVRVSTRGGVNPTRLWLELMADSLSSRASDLIRLKQIFPRLLAMGLNYDAAMEVAGIMSRRKVSLIEIARTTIRYWKRNRRDSVRR